MPKIIQLGSTYAKGQTPYQIFQDRMSAVQGIANGIKKIRENVYTNKVMQQMIDEIDIWKDQQQTDTDIFKFKYQENQENEINESAAIFADILHNQAMGTMRQKEIMMGNLPTPTTGAEALGGIPTIAEPQTEGFAIPKGSMEMIWNYVQSAGGAVDFSKTLELMKNRPKWMGMTDLDTSILNHTMNQPTGMERLGQTADLSKAIQSILFPNLAQQQELATYQAKSNIDIDEFRAKEEIEAAFEKNKGTKWFNTTYGMFNADKGEYVRPDDSITVADYQLFSLSDSSGKSKVLAVDKNNPYSPAVEVPGFNKYFKGKQTTGVSTTGLSKLTAGQENTLKEELLKVATIDDYMNKLKYEQAMGKDISAFTTKEAIAQNFYQKAQDDIKAMNVYMQFIKQGITETEDVNLLLAYREALENYNKDREQYNSLGIGATLPERKPEIDVNEIPKRGYDIRKGKWKGQVNTEELADILLKESKDFGEIVLWINSQADLTQEERMEITEEVLKRMK